jgi:hypothetical protein
MGMAGRERSTAFEARLEQQITAGWFVLAPLVVLFVALGALILLLDRQLQADVDGGQGLPVRHLVWWCAGGAAAIFAAVLMLQTARVARRVAGPEYRLIQCLRRLRGGDLSFRVHLRRGDLLGDLAGECNELIEWLNRNPPRDCRTGTDLIEVERVEMVPVQETEEVAAESRP